MIWFIGVAIALGLVAWFVLRVPGGPRSNLPALRRELRNLTHDPDVADRLVEAEMERCPDLGEAPILRRVIRRLRRDLGR